MIPHILFKFASRSRPEKFFKALDNIHHLIQDKENFSIICSLDEDDKSMTDHFKSVEAFAAFGKKYPNTKAYFGYSKNKIDAVNRDINKAEKHWDILICMSDDFEFIKPGFDNDIRNAFRVEYIRHITEYNFDQFVAWNDGNQKANVSTMSIMGRNYYNRDNYIYHPDYKSVWCDVEATDVAVMRGCYKYMGDDKVIFNHNHPAWGKSDYDAQYRASENLDVWGEDLKTIIERKKIGYGYFGTMFPPKYPMSDVDNWIRDLNNARQNAGMQPINFSE